MKPSDDRSRETQVLWKANLFFVTSRLHSFLIPDLNRACNQSTDPYLSQWTMEPSHKTQNFCWRGNTKSMSMPHHYVTSTSTLMQCQCINVMSLLHTCCGEMQQCAKVVERNHCTWHHTHRLTLQLNLKCHSFVPMATVPDKQNREN